MCRFIAYLGNSIYLDEILIKPENSLINQSYKAREAVEPLNGDGFGLGWYTHEIEPTPGVFKSIQPAWNNQNLVHIAPKITSSCFFAHVRAATEGIVAETNCHPFLHDRILFMHNGGIKNFRKVKRHLRRGLSDELYNWVKGQTDSEHLSAVFIDELNKTKTKNALENMATALRATINTAQELIDEFCEGDTSFLNLAVTDGKNIVASRYVSNTTEPPRTLYYSEGSAYEYKDGVCHMHPAEGNPGAVLIVSEKLDDYKADWHAVPENHMVCVSEDLEIEVQKI